MRSARHESIITEAEQRMEEIEDDTTLDAAVTDLSWRNAAQAIGISYFARPHGRGDQAKAGGSGDQGELKAMG